LNTETNECQWAGANNPLYIVSSRQSAVGSRQSAVGSGTDGLKTEDCELIELKGDKMPVAIHPVMNNFTNHQFKVEKGDCLYLFSDGYTDQFGGQKGKKFMYKRFKELLVQTCPGMSKQIKTMHEQKNELEYSIKQWMGKLDQVDDILVIGIRIV
ncbi:MAG: hypothetical protein COX07_02940, partial [Bacteroidetes bacterium CG23_combo_of_CG06-09_8_20_14_all_32_9]